jgi:PAS domain S-box-containing protein
MFDFISPDLLLWVGIVLVLALSAVVFLQNRQIAKQARDAEQEAERAGEQQLRQIIDLVPHMIFARDADGKFVMANQAVADFYDATVDEIIGKPMADLHPNPDEIDRFAMSDRALIENGRRVEIPEQSFQGRTGDVRTVQTTKIPFKAPGTGQSAVLGISVDITEQKHAEASFGEIVKLAPDAVISIDKDYRIILFNRGAETIFGYDAADIVGQPIHVLLPEHLRAGHSALIDGFDRAPENSRKMNVRGKVFGRRKNGEEFAAEASIGKLKRGGEASFIVLLRDVSEREMWEDQLRHAQKMEAVGQLTGGVAHDFNNLLTIILGNLQLLQRRIDDGPKTDHLFDRAIAAAQRGGDLTHRLLAFSRRTPLDPKLTDLARLVDDIIKLTKRTIGENISVDVTSDDELWRVNIDRAQMQSAIMNLAINAAHAMPGGGDLRIETSNISIDPSLALQLGELDADDYVQISVIDNGVGMTPETAERAFDPFFTTKDVGEGSGLGLSMVHGFVQQSGGQVRILSEPGEGTTIDLYIPRAADDGAEEGDDAPRLSADVDGSETILVVEDDSDVRQIAVNHLAEQGYQVIEAADGPDALQQLQDHENIDVLFTDVMLPSGISGTELASSALRLRPGLKLLFCSGNAKIDVARDFGADSDYIFLPKPYLGGDLAVALRNLIDQ